MKCVILAGGKGTRIAEESSVRPKPMVEIGTHPILWHIMKLYAAFGISEFVVCLGYKGYMIKEYFANYFLHQSDVTFDMKENRVEYHDIRVDPWKVTLVDTGEESMTGGRLLKVGKFLTPGETFCMTYGDGLSNVDMRAQLAFHKRHGRSATVTCVRPPARFGRIVTQNDRVVSFEEKPHAEGGWINGGFFLLETAVLDLIDASNTVWEKEPMERLAGMASCRHGRIKVSGSPWTRCATSRRSMPCGSAVRRRGSFGSGEGNMGLLSRCRACGGQLTVTMADLGLQPASNAFLTDAAAIASEKRYPLRAKVCELCRLVQVDYDVAREELFSNYVYFSSYSDDWLAHARRYCEMARERFALGPHSLVVELASNDGYLLKNFVAAGIPVLGIDPSDTVAAAAQALGVPTLVEFFGLQAADRLARERQADLIIGNNVLAHVPDLNDFVAGIARLLKPNGSVTIEFPHLLELIEHVEFDTIYHEHYSYISLLAIEKVFARHGLRLYDLETLATHGGSLRIFASHLAREGLQDSAKLLEIRAREDAAGLNDLATYARFARRVEECRESLREFLGRCRREGKSVAAYGAAAKGNTLLNYCAVTPHEVAMVGDRNPHKQSKLTPGTHIPVVSPEALMQSRPDYVLILPWNLQSEIRGQLKAIEQWGGRFVTPVPLTRVY